MEKLNGKPGSTVRNEDGLRLLHRMQRADAKLEVFGSKIHDKIIEK